MFSFICCNGAIHILLYIYYKQTINNPFFSENYGSVKMNTVI